jgi:hypothetical protein
MESELAAELYSDAMLLSAFMTLLADSTSDNFESDALGSLDEMIDKESDDEYDEEVVVLVVVDAVEVELDDVMAAEEASILSDDAWLLFSS